MWKRKLCWAGLLGLATVSCTPLDGQLTEGRDQQPIVGGVAESGWRGVGALAAQVPFWGYEGAFCTATLIDPRWVLTAAHCVEDEAGDLLNPSTVRFYVGSDARPASDGQLPASGTLYAVDRLLPHPHWDPATLRNDIALVHLSQAATGVPVYAYRQQSLASALVGRPVLYVGFGATEGVQSSGGGVKRSAQIAVASMGTSTYAGSYAGSGVCFGDSGGPGLVQDGGVWQIIGVNSSVSGAGLDPCKGTYNHTRVDRFAPWIAETLGQTPPSCQADPGLCTCAQACQPDGSCVASACQTRSCEQIYACALDCGDDVGCQLDCYDTGTADAQQDLDAMLRCFDAQCGSSATEAAYLDCTARQCGAAIDACMPPANCDLRGGDCSSAEACAPTRTGATDCRPSQGLTAGATCRLGARELLECADGLVCLGPPGGATGRCSPMCLSTADCAGGETCDRQRLPELNGGGVCVCTDLDLDGACAPVDCDDGDARRHPGAAELCGDALDNNCNGQVDEGCASCVDTDGDGACAEIDCDDTRADARPGLPETCGDHRDNDCDGLVDQGCATCVDADADGACLPADCDDARVDVRPGLAEACDDGRDNDCDGQIDEGCAACTDEDRDGVCLGVDCDDTRADVRPGLAEACGDGRDNNCSGQIDEGCVLCVDEDQDGFCANRDCDDGDATANEAQPERCGDRVDNDCDRDVDEDCAACVDADGDGSCLPADCDDARIDVRPGLVEACGDGRDNNCDGEVDEECTWCVDQDEDGFCENRDCDDADANVHPGQVERCGDGSDNDCDGEIDEDCGGCVDVDGDGFCAELDCDDGLASVHPGADEQCGDGLDNSCDGRVDEGCASCLDLDKDGFCQELDCDDGNAARSPAAAEVCGDQVDDNCDGEIDEGCSAPPDTSRRPHVDEPVRHEPMLCRGVGGAPGGLLFVLLLGLGWRRREGQGAGDRGRALG